MNETRLAPLAAALRLAPLVFALGACGPEGEPSAASTSVGPETSSDETLASAEPRPLEGTLEWALTGDWRPEADAARDADEKPAELAAFFEIEPQSNVLEIWPGGGWHAAVFAPYLKANGGGYRVAAPPAPDDAVVMGEVDDGFDARFDDAEVFGDISGPTFDAVSGALAEPGSLDVILSVSDVHAWMALGVAEKAFADAYEALKPGGVLAIVEAAARGDGFQDPSAATGYVQPAHVKLLAAEAGFAFEAASPVLGNDKDDTDHPFGVWTLSPYLRSSPIGEPDDAAFDAAPYAAIGAANRMALKFVKPVGE